MTALVDKMRQLPLLLRLAGLGVTGAGGAALLTVSGAEGGLAIAGFALLALVAVIVLVWLLRIWFSARERKKSARLHEALVSGRSQLAVSDDDLQKLAELRDQWRKAVEQLKGAQLDPYSMPWYLLIGEPQSGKTTTIRNSGLEFPVGTDALSGPEGTRNCDFWFTNQAVILDTAGRYTFQEWDRPYSKEFEEFLRLLRRFRARCPINGVIVSIPSTSLLGDDDATRDAKAKNIRDKLQTIEQILEVQFPVYLLITKCDLVLGFTEFFGKLPALEQRQLLGWSNPEPFGNGFTPEMFDRGFAALAAELERWRLKFLAESTGSDLDRLFGFPDEFAVLRSRLHDYVTTIFSENRYADPLFFRGFYFTSGLQKGRPMSKACASLMRSADGGPDAKDLAEIFERSSAFFIRDFYKRKLFPEKGLISPTRRFLKRRRQIEQGAYLGAGSLGAILVVTLVWWIIAIDTPFQAPRTAVEQSAQLPGTASLADALADAENLLGNIRHIQQHGLEAGLLPWHKLVGEDKTRIVKAMGNVLVKRVIDRVVSPVAQSVEAILIDAPPPQAPYGPGSAYWKAAEEYLALRSWQKLASMGERDQGAAVRDTWTHIDGMLQLIADLGPATDTFPQINENRARISELYKAMVALHAPPWSVETDLAHVLTRRMNEASAKICTTVRDYWNALIANQFASPQTEAAEALAWRRIAEWDALLKSKYQQCLKIDWPEQPGRRGDVEAMVTTFKTLVGEPRVGIRALRASLDQEIAERPQRGISIGASLKQQLSSFDGCYAGWMVLAGNDRVLRDQLDNDRKGLGQRLEEKCRDAEGALSAGGFYVEVESAKPAEGAKAADKQAAPAWTLKVKPAVAKSVQVLEALFLVCEQADKTSDALQGTDTVAVALRELLARLQGMGSVDEDPIGKARAVVPGAAGAPPPPFDPASYHDLALLEPRSVRAHRVLWDYSLGSLLKSYASAIQVTAVEAAFAVRAKVVDFPPGLAKPADSFFKEPRQAILEHFDGIAAFDQKLRDEDLRKTVDAAIAQLRRTYLDHLAKQWQAFYQSFQFAAKEDDTRDLKALVAWLSNNSLHLQPVEIAATAIDVARRVREHCSTDDKSPPDLAVALRQFSAVGALAVDEPRQLSLRSDFQEFVDRVRQFAGSDCKAVLSQLANEKRAGTSLFGAFDKSRKGYNDYWTDCFGAAEQLAQDALLNEAMQEFRLEWADLGKRPEFADCKTSFPFADVSQDVPVGTLVAFFTKFEELRKGYELVLPKKAGDPGLLKLALGQKDFIVRTKALRDFLLEDSVPRVSFQLEWNPSSITTPQGQVLFGYEFYRFTAEPGALIRLNRSSASSQLGVWNWGAANAQNSGRVMFELLTDPQGGYVQERTFAIDPGPLALLRFLRRYGKPSGNAVIVQHRDDKEHAFIEYRLLFQHAQEPGKPLVLKDFPVQLPLWSDASWGD